ncbi:ead/Ea22-like family protein [Enterobacter hormaechei]|uniref:ead/Ea22-like family protein n=1 Tax=Enterobacter hormaechei TaxID=158836 RepID=UPI0032188B7F
MSNIDKRAKRALREAAETAKDNFIPSFKVPTRDLLALLDELEAAEKKTVEMPTFDGYVPHVARELQAAFRIACDNAGINVAAAAGKGD